MTLVIILLAIIVYFLWKIYNQREEEKNEAKVKADNEEKEVERKKIEEEDEANREREEKEFKEKYQVKYPHLIGKIEDTWLETFGGMYVEKGLPHLKAAEMMYIQASNNTRQSVGVDFMFDALWDLSKELLEHLEKYHEGTVHEFDIAIVTYWQIAVTKADSFIGEKNPATLRKLFQSSPFTDIQNIPSWFPRKQTHPKDEISFVDEKNNSFPRGLDNFEEKVKALER